MFLDRGSAQQKKDLDGETVTKDGFETKSDSEKTPSRLSAFMLDARNANEDD